MIRTTRPTRAMLWRHCRRKSWRSALHEIAATVERIDGRAERLEHDVTFARPSYPEQAQVRTRVHELAVAEAREGGKAAIENVPWPDVKSIRVNGVEAAMRRSDSRIEFTIPKGFTSGEVADVLLDVPNVGVFHFPLTIK